jgi:hypothetical protein
MTLSLSRSSIGCYIRRYSAAYRCFLCLFACLLGRGVSTRGFPLSTQPAGNKTLTQPKAIAADTSRQQTRFHWILPPASVYSVPSHTTLQHMPAHASIAQHDLRDVLASL